MSNELFADTTVRLSAYLSVSICLSARVCACIKACTINRMNLRICMHMYMGSLRQYLRAFRAE